MKTTAVILAKGCEEGEALTIADILRRCEVPCDLIGLVLYLTTVKLISSKKT